MLRALSPDKIIEPHLSMMGVLAFVCCLMCLPSVAQAEIMPPPLYMWEVPTEAEAQAEPEAPSAFTPLRSHLLRPSLGQGQTATAPENNSQRKKKKRTFTQDNKHMAFLAWLAAFCMPPCPMQKAYFPLVEREDIPCLPSWRGFVFFPLPPPQFS